MAWTSPLTFVANSVLTAAQLNTHLRDNLNETAVAKATAAGRIFVSTGVNAIAERIIDRSTVNTAESTVSTSYANLATSGPAATVTTGTRALVFISAEMSNSGTNHGWVAVAVSGATTIAASDQDALQYQAWGINADHRGTTAVLVIGLTPGSNTFTLQYRVDAGTGTFSNRNMIVMGL